MREAGDVSLPLLSFSIVMWSHTLPLPKHLGEIIGIGISHLRSDCGDRQVKPSPGGRDQVVNSVSKRCISGSHPHAYLYTCVVELWQHGRCIDTYEQLFGVRTVEVRD